jgi:hypothetical protein
VWGKMTLQVMQGTRWQKSGVGMTFCIRHRSAPIVGNCNLQTFRYGSTPYMCHMDVINTKMENGKPK